MTRVAAIDCGTNSIRLLVADTAPGGALHDVHRETRIVRLGQDVDRTGRLAADALERTRVAVGDYAAIVAGLRAERVRMVATSATRDAANRSEFVDLVRAELGVEPEVISGAEEAALSFAGAAGGLPAGAFPLLLADIGGGSSELVRGGGAAPLIAHSMDIGSVRMTERHLHDDPPTADQVAAAERDVRRAIAAARADVSLERPVTLVGVAGTVTTVAALALGLSTYSRDAIHGAVVSAEQVRAVAHRLLTLPHDERAAVPVIHPGRVDIIGGGVIILRTLLDEVGVDELVASEHDILDGIALSLV
ncbi:MAG TPA: Ppx/GppA phosphatase family protein [Jatrophihabitans sp.]|uniref:Ppx/GppA phosphatase family protein n=1 Tax=Jatrophihabitans sp. TaxID=1932789 RepID=UPI002E09BE6C|nr:Ppx/GppA phosphatase family protein [Jatrophihabitans sp.]